ncbi:MAG TPA: IS1 family transposase [Acetobacteraceae bacterium]|nr:IS1 family transposase [Acetobacteraceae bacterium]
MNKLARAERIQVLALLCEGMSMRAASRVSGVSYNTVCTLLRQAGEACAEFHDKAVRNVHAKRVQCDEIWSFCYAKQKNVPTAKAAPEMAGNLWTWLGLDADSKLIISYLVGNRGGEATHALMQDMAERLADRVQLTSDGHKAYLEAVETAFGVGVDYAMLIKMYGDAPGAGRYSPGECIGARKEIIEGRPDPKHIYTSYVERQNLNLRMGIRRFTRLTNAFSKSAEAHYHMMALYVVFHNFCRDHKAPRMTPAEAAGLIKSAMTVSDIVTLIEAREAPPKKRGPYKPRQPRAVADTQVAV